MRKKLWFAIIDIALLTAISYAANDGKMLWFKSFSIIYIEFIIQFAKWRNSSDELLAKDEAISENEVLVGDMILSKDQMSFLYTMNSTQRLGLASPFNRWPNATVFYSMDKSMDQKGRETVIAAMEYIQNVSCVRFKVKDGTTRNYVLIKAGKACSSRVGMRRGAQQMIVDGKLCSQGSVVHELLHALGFLHLHTTCVKANLM